MAYPNALEVCRADLFTAEAELRERYPAAIADKVMRVREMYNLYLSNPSQSDRDVVAMMVERYPVHRATVYADLQVVKSLLPMLSTASRDFHRWKANEMLMATYDLARKKQDPRSMERSASTYAKINRVDMEDEQPIPYEQLLPQPFMATDDPRVLGIEPIPNIQDKIAAMIQKYRAETIDIDDVEFEEVDLELDVLFPDKIANDRSQESIL